MILCILSGCGDKNVKSSRVDHLPFYDEATFTPKWTDSKNAELNNFHKISPFQLTNQDNEEITNETFSDKIYVTNFFFTICPGICPKMTENMSLVYDEFLDDSEVLLMSHSVTPKRDSVPVLKSYAEDRGIESDKWHLVTGTRSEIYRMGRFEYMVEQDMGLEMDEDDFLHSENFVLVDHNKHIRGIYNGLSKNDINQLIADIRTLKREI